ncbi:acetyl-CoA C-acyltransferase [Mycolicibacter kumamotonensis]|uniref:Acetyl-CoA C-acyltransferase n=1 Tax=Mycolicibacter kumamotonensis TaxID=354243 RepID=A0A7K3LBN4_9MYCO|nr:acetyl-CoA C-acyltransferase [Mycolicibacter kumamotonensis]NDJ89712.1 acetyl-CoA C-acyltransferase [Mycolicibacter kumamotonensis]
MTDVVVVDAIRTPFGKRSGGLAGMHSVELLGAVQRCLLERVGIDFSAIDQVIAGCVAQVGMQALNVGRNAWLTAGLPVDVPAVTIDTQCGSSQQAVGLAHALISSGAAKAVVACGVEVMSTVKMGSTVPADGHLGKPVTRNYWKHHEYTSQFEGAERMAETWSITRAQADEFGKLSQDRAAAAQASGAFDSQLIPVDAPVLSEDRTPTGEMRTVTQDEGVRETSLEKLATLKPTGRENGVHTAATSSQISDGASAVLLMSSDAAAAAGFTPMAKIVATALVGTDPVLMLTGPIAATHQLLAAGGLAMSDIDVVEINEAFAAVVLAWERELKPDMSIVNPNGGAIAMGHPLGATGAALVAKAVHQLAHVDGEYALVTMCCGGGLGTGTLLQRV